MSFNRASIRVHGLRSRIDHSHVSIIVIQSPIVPKIFNKWLYHLNVLAVVQRNCHFRVNIQYKSKFSKVILSQVKVIKVKETYWFFIFAMVFAYNLSKNSLQGHKNSSIVPHHNNYLGQTIAGRYLKIRLH